SSPHWRPTLLIVVTGWRQFREYLLKSIGSRYRIHLFLAADPTWEHEYIEGWTVLPDTMDGPAMIAAARQLADRQPIDGVLCSDEGRIHLSAQIAQALGLPGGNPDAVLRCRDKHRTRQALAAAGVAQPKSALVGTVAQALEIAAEFGYPVILKPRALAGSLGV